MSNIIFPRLPWLLTKYEDAVETPCRTRLYIVNIRTGLGDHSDHASPLSLPLALIYDRLFSRQLW